MDIYEVVGILNTNYAMDKGDHIAWVRTTLCNKERNGIGIWQYFFDPEKLRFFLHDIRAVKLLQTYEINIDE
jgi:hypothetical protein